MKNYPIMKMISKKEKTKEKPTKKNRRTTKKKQWKNLRGEEEKFTHYF